MTGTGLQANAPCNKYHFVSRASDYMLTHFQLFSEVSSLCMLTHRVNSHSCTQLHTYMQHLCVCGIFGNKSCADVC